MIDYRLRAMVAHLIRRFKLTIPQIRALTDRQIRTLYGHPEDENGNVKEQAEAPPAGTLAGDLFRAEAIAAAFQMPPAAAAKLRADVRARHATKEAAGGEEAGRGRTG